MKIDNNIIQKFRGYLIEEEKSFATVNKYVHDVNAFAIYLSGQRATKTKMLEYKNYLLEKYALTSVNGAIASLNSFFCFAGRSELKLKSVKIQRRIFAKAEREISKNEYQRLLKAAKEKKNKRLFYLMQTICATGIRVSELKFITVEAVKQRYVSINCKGKIRQVILPLQLCKILNTYIKEQKLKKGSVFVTKSGTPLDRSNIWNDMKNLCHAARVDKSKVFPHNLRHLFARTYYSVEKDIVRLADILGHSSVNTTRIYTMETGEVHRRQIERLNLLLC